MSSFAALLQRRRSLFSIRPPTSFSVPPSTDNAALRFSPSRRGCNRASLSRSRYTRATDVCSRAVLSSARYRHRSRCTHESQLHRGATKKNTRCIFVAFIGRDIAASRRSRDVACGLFRLLPRSDCPSPSSVSDVRLASPHEEHPVPSRSRSLLLQTRNAIDSLAL